MKKILMFVAALALSMDLFAGTDLAGTWYGQSDKGGEPMSFKIAINENGMFFMTYDAEPQRLVAYGNWTLDEEALSFKQNDKVLQFDAVDQKSEDGAAERTLEFQMAEGNLQFQTDADWSVFFEWDSAQTSVTVSKTR